MDPLSQYAEQGNSNSSTPYSRSPSPSFQPTPGNVDQNGQDMENSQDMQGDQDLQPPPTSSVFNLSSYDLKAEGVDDIQGVGEEVKVKKTIF